MTNIINAKIEAIIAEYRGALVTIDALLNEIGSGEGVLSKSLFSCASFESRCGSEKKRELLYKERAKHFAWGAIVDAIKDQDGETALYNQYAYTSGTYYTFDIKESVMSPFFLADAYKGDTRLYAGRAGKLAEVTADNIEKLYELLQPSAVNDAHHVWSFLNKCGASYMKDATTFKARMTWRATADTYGGGWRDGIANMYRIFCQHTGRAWSWDNINAEIRNNSALLKSGGLFDAFGDMATFEKNGNGNSTVKFSPEAVRVFNSFNGGIDYKDAHAHFSAIANAII